MQRISIFPPGRPQPLYKRTTAPSARQPVQKKASNIAFGVIQLIRNPLGYDALIHQEAKTLRNLVYTLDTRVVAAYLASLESKLKANNVTVVEPAKEWIILSGLYYAGQLRNHNMIHAIKQYVTPVPKREPLEQSAQSATVVWARTAINGTLCDIPDAPKLNTQFGTLIGAILNSLHDVNERDEVLLSCLKDQSRNNNAFGVNFLITLLGPYKKEEAVWRVLREATMFGHKDLLDQHLNDDIAADKRRTLLELIREIRHRDWIMSIEFPYEFSFKPEHYGQIEDAIQNKISSEKR